VKAAVLVQTKQPLEVVELRMPEQLSFGQVHVKVHYSGICGAQINEIEGAKGPDKFLPHLLGHEGSGVVVRIGPGVKTVQPGDHVVLHWRPSAGLQAEPAKYDWNGKTVNAGWVTTFNDEAIISENRLTVIPKDFDLKLAPLFGCAVTTAVGVVNNDAQIKIGQSVVIFGVGGVGLNIAQAAEMVSAYPIIGVDIVEAKVEMAKKWGVTHEFNSKAQPDYLEKIKALLGTQGADVVVDKGDNVNIYTLPLHFKKVLKGSHGGSSVPDVEIPRLIRLMKQGKMKLDGLFTHSFDLANINEAIQALRLGGAGRVLVCCSKL